MEAIKNSGDTKLFFKDKVSLPFDAQVKSIVSQNRGKLGIAAGIAASAAFVSLTNLIDDGEKEQYQDATATPLDAGTESTLTFSAPGLIAQADENVNFEDAFSKARQEMGAGGVFEYQGKLYNTFFKEEWQGMSIENQNQYYASISEKIDLDSAVLETRAVDGTVNTHELTDENIHDISIVSNDPEQMTETSRNLNSVQDLSIDPKSAPEVESIILEPADGDHIFDQPNVPITNDAVDPGSVSAGLNLDSNDLPTDNGTVFISDDDVLDPSHDLVDMSDILDSGNNKPIILDLEGGFAELPDMEDDIDVSEFE